MLTAAAVTVLGAGILTASTAFAQSTTTAQDPMNTLVQKIADKFNLNESEVQAVFDEAHEEQHAKMQAGFEEKLSQYVESGELTEEQKKLILEKRLEMNADREANKEAFKNLSDEERKAQKDAKRAELEAWAEENNIDLQYLMLKGGKGPGFGGRGDFGQRNQGQQSTTEPTPIASEPTVTQ